MATTLPLTPPAVREADEDRFSANVCGRHDVSDTPARPPVPGWALWLSNRLLTGALTIFVVSLIVFLATQALPSDPARVILGPEATEQAVATLRAQLGLDQPIWAQYIDWAGKVVVGDFGTSLDSGVSAGSILSERLGNTVALSLVSLAVAIPLAFLIGVSLAIRRDSKADRWAMTGLILFKALPSFTIAIGLILLFSTTVMQILPAVSLLEPGVSPYAQPLYLILPAATLVLVILPFLARLIRAGMIETLESEFVTAARLRGLPERRVIWRHAVPNALPAAIQGIAMTTRMLLGGALIVEVVFSYPGIGNALNAAIEMRDIPVIQAITLAMAVAVVLVNVIADAATVLVTPRLRTAARPGIRAGTRAKLKLKAGGV